MYPALSIFGRKDYKDVLGMLSFALRFLFIYLFFGRGREVIRSMYLFTFRGATGD